MSISTQHLEAIRSFNRSFTKHLGLLEKTPYDETLNLLEARVIFEIQARDGILAKDLARDLGVDKGYLSRILTALARRRLILWEENPDDRREKKLRLSALGRDKFAKINRASAGKARTLLEQVGLPKALAFAGHLAEADMILRAQDLKVEDISLRGFQQGDIGWVISKHNDVYFGEYGWNEKMEILTAEIVLSFAQNNDPKYERAWIAEAGGVRLGCVFLVRESATVAKLRILLVDPCARGLGLGRRLVDEALAFAKAAGYSKVILWTNDVLTSARKIYEKTGFKLIKEEKHNTFGKTLNGQYWAKKLT